MIYKSRPRKRTESDEPEKPFWISYADLMTSLMMLFLAIMVTSLIIISQKTKAYDEYTSQYEERTIDKQALCSIIQKGAENSPYSVVVQCNSEDHQVHFGDVGRFKHDDHRLSVEGVKALRSFVPVILEAASSQEGQKWMKQIQIEGFTDTDGSYLYNLHLSMQRSEFVMCSMIDDRLVPEASKAYPLTPEQKQKIRKLFLAGGVSFNHSQETKEQSRRVELRIVFIGVNEKNAKNQKVENDDIDPLVLDRDYCRIYNRAKR